MESDSGYGENLDPNARAVLRRAADEAQRLGQDYIGPEHLLLGLIALPAIETLLRRLDVQPDELRRQIQSIVPKGPPKAGEPPVGRLTPRSKKVLDLAALAARERGQQTGAIDILAGILMDGENSAAGVLRSMGIDRKRVAQEATPVGPAPPAEGGTSHTEGSFDRFTERARKVLSLAQEESQRFNHNYIGTEHILLGLVREGEGVAAKILANLGVELTKVRTAVEFIIGRGERPPQGEIGLTPRAKKVIELAVDEARRLGHHYVGTEHLLLGLIREGEGIAAGVLESLGVSLEKVRAQVIKVLTQTGPTPLSPPVSEPPERRARIRRGLAYAILYLRWNEQEPVVVRAAGIDLAEGTELETALRLMGETGWQLDAVDPSGGAETLYI